MILEPTPDRHGGYLFRQYRVSAHAIDRYRQRIEREVCDLFDDLKEAVLFETMAAKGRTRRLLASNDARGGYALLSGDVIFIVRAEVKLHHVITILSLRESNAAKVNHR